MFLYSPTFSIRLITFKKLKEFGLDLKGKGSDNNKKFD